MDKLKLPSRSLDVLEKEKIKSDKDYGVPIRMRKVVWDAVGNVSDETGFSKVDVIEKLVMFAIDNIEYVTTKEYKEGDGTNGN